MSLYTWNVRTGALDDLAKNTGLELAGLALLPGSILTDRVQDFWDHYVYLVGVRQENDDLREKIKTMSAELAVLRERAAEADRLARLLMFSPPPEWVREGARVVAQRLGPSSALETLLIDKGEADGYGANTPVMTPEGVVGRVLRAGRALSTVLLISDLNSAVAVLGQDSRSAGILMGGGPGQPLQVHYVPLNAPLLDGELLVTSGVDGIFPKGLPVARVTKVEASHVYSLFQEVEARPLVDIQNLEETLLLRRPEPPQEDARETEAPGRGAEKPVARPEQKIDARPAPRPDPKAERRSDPKTDQKTAPRADAPADRPRERKPAARPPQSVGAAPDRPADAAPGHPAAAASGHPAAEKPRDSR